MTRTRTDYSPEERREQTAKARRANEFRFAEDRIRKIAENYQFTDEQLAKLAVLLKGAGE